MFTKIMLCSDGSVHALKAAEKAVSLAKLYYSSILLLNVHPDSSHAITVPWQLEAGDADTGIQVTALQRANLDATVELCRKAGVRYQSRQECGHAAEQIIRTAEDEGADLIVMGCRGLSEWKALLLGSVSTHVLHHAHCSVLIVR